MTPSKEAIEAGRATREVIDRLGIPEDVFKYYLSVLAVAAAGSNKPLGHYILSISRQIGTLMNRHFSDMRDGSPDPQDEKAFIRDLFAVANKILAGEEL